MTTELATKDATAAKDTINNLQKNALLDTLRDQGLPGVTLLSSKIKVSIFQGNRMDEYLHLKLASLLCAFREIQESKVAICVGFTV